MPRKGVRQVRTSRRANSLDDGLAIRSGYKPFDPESLKARLWKLAWA
jgi:hypothetical protein